MSYFSRPRLSLGAYLIVARAIGKALRAYDSPALPDTDQASGQAAIAVAVTQPTATLVTVAQTTIAPVVAGSSITHSDEPPTWLIIALVMQVSLLLIAGVEFIRRARRRR